jgi:hypothetical protein
VPREGFLDVLADHRGLWHHEPIVNQHRHDAFGIQRQKCRLELLAAKDIDNVACPLKVLLLEREPRFCCAG